MIRQHPLGREMTSSGQESGYLSWIYLPSLRKDSTPVLSPCQIIRQDSFAIPKVYFFNFYFYYFFGDPTLKVLSNSLDFFKVFFPARHYNKIMDCCKLSACCLWDDRTDQYNSGGRVLPAGSTCHRGEWTVHLFSHLARSLGKIGLQYREFCLFVNVELPLFFQVCFQQNITTNRLL
jgi:hypothetical protein